MVRTLGELLTNVVRSLLESLDVRLGRSLGVGGLQSISSVEGIDVRDDEATHEVLDGVGEVL